MKRTTIAVDVAKTVFELAVSPQPGKVSETHRFSCAKFLTFFRKCSSCTVVMEACGSSHHWARKLEALGHHAVLLPAAQVRPYVLRNKTDATDARAILEAYRNKDIHPVPVKSAWQQALAAVLNLRTQWMETRTARLNSVRASLRELGVFIPVGARNVVPAVHALLADPPSALVEAIDLLRPALHAACEEIGDLEQKAKDCAKQLRSLSRQMPVVQKLQQVPGVGLLTAVALVAFVGDVKRFPTGRHFASYLGLTPREHSSGRIRRLGSISKRGNAWLRTLLVTGSQAVLQAAKRQAHPDRFYAWALQLRQTRGHNKAAVALANKRARILWAIWSRDTEYQSYACAA